LVHYYDECFAKLAKEEGGLTRDKAGLKQAVIALLSPCAKARVDLKKAVPAGWNGAPEIDAKLPDLLEKAEAKKTANNAKTRGARQVGTAVAKSGPVGTAPTASVNPAPVAGPLAGLAGVQEASERNDDIPSWASHLNGLQAMLSGLVAKCPAEAAKAVEAQVGIMSTALATIRKVCQEAAVAAAPASPAGKLVKKDVK